jgi:hypothetical protein
MNIVHKLPIILCMRNVFMLKVSNMANERYFEVILGKSLLVYKCSKMNHCIA